MFDTNAEPDLEKNIPCDTDPVRRRRIDEERPLAFSYENRENIDEESPPASCGNVNSKA